MSVRVWADVVALVKCSRLETNHYFNEWPWARSFEQFVCVREQEPGNHFTELIKIFKICIHTLALKFKVVDVRCKYNAQIGFRVPVYETAAAYGTVRQMYLRAGAFSNLCINFRAKILCVYFRIHSIWIILPNAIAQLDWLHILCLLAAPDPLWTSLGSH